MQEYSRPLNEHIEYDANIFSILEDRVERHPDDPLVEYIDESGKWQSFSAKEFRNKVVCVAKGLIARGIMPGDSVSIIAHTSWQWTVLDLAIMSIGALTVPVYETNSQAQMMTIFKDSNVCSVFVESPEMQEKVLNIKDQVPSVKDVYTLFLVMRLMLA